VFISFFLRSACYQLTIARYTFRIVGYELAFARKNFRKKVRIVSLYLAVLSFFSQLQVYIMQYWEKKSGSTEYRAIQLINTFSFLFYFQNYMCLAKKKKAKKYISFGERHAHQAIFQPRLQHLNNTFTSSSCINIMHAMTSAMKISSESLTLWFIYQSHEIIICFTLFSALPSIGWTYMLIDLHISSKQNKSCFEICIFWLVE